MKNISYNTIIFTAIAIVAGITIYPPFIAKSGAGKVFNMGYHLIWKPPADLATVNTSMLLIQILVISMVAVALSFLKHKSDD